MKKIKSPKKGFIKYLALVPSIIIALGLFTAANAQQKAINGKVVFEDGSPAPGSSIVVAGGTQGTVADRDGTFSLELEGNPELWVSFVGFKSVKVYAKDLAKNDVVLHPEVYEIDLKDVKAADPKAKKTTAKSNKSPGEADKNSEEITAADELVFYIVEDMPSFPGGRELMKAHIIENLVYPEKAKKKGISGEVYVQFTVGTKGQLKDFEIKKSSDKIFNEAATNVLKNMPAWNPGKQRGKPINILVIVPVRFTAEQD